MTVNYTIQAKDLLTLQLFLTSRSESIKKKRQKSRFSIPIFYLLIAIFGIFINQEITALLFLAGAVLWLLFYPVWEGKRYIRHFNTYIQESLKDRLENTTSIEITNASLFIKENDNESKISSSEIEVINDIPSLIIIQLKGGSAFPIPKDQIPDLENLKSRLQELASYLTINYQIDDKWGWK